ncbi:hypothetical protein, partial [Streptomyces sp. NPDC003952]
MRGPAGGFYGAPTGPAVRGSGRPGRTRLRAARLRQRRARLHRGRPLRGAEFPYPPFARSPGCARTPSG